MNPPSPDLLFVFAGSDARKRFALDAWRRGAAPVLAVSVARFEWRRVPSLGLPGEGGLVRLVDATPPRERLFLLVAEVDRVGARRVAKGRWGTWSEALGLAALARERGSSSLIVCTSGYHLPRAMLASRRALDLAGMRSCELVPLAAVELPGAEPLGGRRSGGRRESLFRVLERVKWLVYALGLPMLLQRPRTDFDATRR